MENLNPKQIAFCHEYLKDFNGTKAAIRAGYSEKSAKSTASVTLTNPNVQKMISHLSKEHFKTIGLHSERIIFEIVQIAFDVENPLKCRMKALEILLDTSTNSDSNSRFSDTSKIKMVLENLKSNWSSL